MKVTSKETYKVVRAVLELKKFTQYRISKKENVTFSLVNRVVNWLLDRSYVAKRKGYYEVMAPGSIFSLFPLHRKMKSRATFDVDLSREEILKLIKGRGMLCLTSAISYYDGNYRDPAIYAYLKDERMIQELKGLPKGYTHLEIYEEDLNGDDFVSVKGQRITTKSRTIIDLFCANKAYVAERLIKKEWIR